MRARFEYLVRLTDRFKTEVVTLSVSGVDREDALANAKFLYPKAATIELVEPTELDRLDALNRAAAAFDSFLFRGVK